MPAIEVDQDLMDEIVRLKEVVKGSVDAVMEGSLTAGHLASDVYALLDILDMLENIWRGTQSAEEAQAEQPPSEGQQ